MELLQNAQNLKFQMIMLEYARILYRSSNDAIDDKVYITYLHILNTFMHMCSIILFCS